MTANAPMIPCPMCGRQNALTRKTCGTCGYAFVEPSNGEQGSVFKKVVGRLRGR
jgi:ribosomal protein S27E